MRIDFEWVKNKARYEFTHVSPTICHAYVHAFLMYIHREGYEVVKKPTEAKEIEQVQLRFNIKS